MTTPNMSQTNPMVGFLGSIKLGFRRYADFKGRSTRAEFWWWVLFIVLSIFIVLILDAVVAAFVPNDVSPLFSLFLVGTLVPNQAVAVRRLHDIGKRGRWLLAWYGITVAAWLGAMALLFVAATKSSLPNGEYTYFDLYAFVGPGAAAAVISLIILSVVTLVVMVWSIVWLARQGQPGLNRFGPDPRAVESAEVPEV